MRLKVFVFVFVRAKENETGRSSWKFGSGNRHRRTGVWSNYQRFIYFYSHNTSSFLRDVECSLRPSKTLMLFPPPLSFRLLRAADGDTDAGRTCCHFYSFFSSRLRRPPSTRPRKQQQQAALTFYYSRKVPVFSIPGNTPPIWSQRACCCG